MPKIIAFYGSPGSGKTSIALKTAMETYIQTKDEIIAFLSPDMTVPSVALLFPNYAPDEVVSLSDIFDNTAITNESLLKNGVTVKNGTKYCKKSIGIEEKVLHEAICRGISKVVPNKSDILDAIKATLEFAVTGEKETLNKYNIELNIKYLQDEADMLMERAMKTEGDQERYFVEIEKLYDKIKALREQLELAQFAASETPSENAEIKRIIEIFENESFDFSEYDDMVIRRIVECIKVMHDRTIVIILKGGFEICEKIG